MEFYISKLNKDLIELGAVEINSKLFEKYNDNCQINLINPKDEIRKFKYNCKSHTIEGRGIKGFFSIFGNRDYILISKALEENTYIIKTSPLGIINKDNIANNITNPKYLNKSLNVLEKMSSLNSSNESWYQMSLLSQHITTGNKDNELISIPHLKDINLYDYQQKTVKLVLNKFHGRVLMCDEVGLGKTIEAGMAMTEYIMRGLAKKILILTPPSLVEQWYHEMKRKFNLDFIKFDDPDFKKQGDNAYSEYNKVIASISTAKKKQNSEIISSIQYDLIIVDEAHHLKNRKTVAWQFVNSLKKKYIFLLSATPVQNSLEELYNLITLLRPGQLKTYSYFKANFVKDNKGLEVKNAVQLKKLIKDVMIRNRRSDVDIKFTKRFASTSVIAMHKHEQQLHNMITEFIREKAQDHSKTNPFNKLILKNLLETSGSSLDSLISTLRNLSDSKKFNANDALRIEEILNFAISIAFDTNLKSSKVEALIEIIKKFKDKILIFTKYKSTQKALSSILKIKGFEVAEFNGEMRRVQKESQISLFKESAQILVSTESGGEGRNLQFCNAIINYDIPWNPLAIEQRIGRIHRVGQTRDVYVFNLAAQNTLEHYILDILDKKINLFELVVGELDMILGDIEEEEEFSDMILKAFLTSYDDKDVITEINKIGDKILQNKMDYLKMKEFDDNLFGNINNEE